MELGPAPALATAVEGLLVVDRAGALTYANPAAERILGRPAAELAQCSPRGWKATAVDGAPMGTDELPVLRVIRTGEPSATTAHCVERPDGTTAVVSHTASLIRDPSGAVEGAVASLVDITERPPTVEGDLRTELTFRAFVERSPDGVALYRHDKVVYLNPALVAMLGYDSLDELVGRSVIEFVHPEDRVTVGERIRALRDRNVEAPVMAERLLRRDGSVIDVEVSSRPIAYEGEAAVLAMVVDISERKRILKELDHPVSMLRATLDSTADGILVVDEEGRITTFNERFVEMWRIIELDTMRDQFIRVAAHELKTPVAIMKGYADLLLRSAEQLPPALRGGAQAIERGAKRIDRLVGDMLGVSQLLMGCLELRREKVALAELVDVMVGQITATSTKHRIRVDSEPVVVFADRVRLTQVLDTLLDNAMRYSPRGGDIEVTVAARGHEVTVCVRDHGVGIPREKQARIFERFYRAHTDTPHDYGGMGVGLYIAREVIKQHGGRMWFESEEDSGSKFCFSLES